MISAVHRIEFSTPNGRRKERKNQFQLLIAFDCWAGSDAGTIAI